MTISTTMTRRAGIGAMFAAGVAFAGRAFAQSTPQPAIKPATPMSQKPPPPAAPQAPPQNVVRDRQALLVETEIALIHARDHLMRTNHEYGGHRLRALQAINMALTETNAARGFLA